MALEFILIALLNNSIGDYLNPFFQGSSFKLCSLSSKYPYFHSVYLQGCFHFFSDRNVIFQGTVRMVQSYVFISYLSL